MTFSFSSYPCPVCAASSIKTRYTINDFNIVECISCGMVYVDPRICNEDLFSIYRNGYFDRGSEESGYQDYELVAPLRIKTFKKWYNAFKRYLPSGYSAALDVGCAAGYFMDLLKEEGWRVVEGVELETHMIAELRERKYSITGQPLEHITAPPLKRYQLITLFDVLEHLPDINNDLEKCASMLDDNGILVLVTPNVDSFQRKLFGPRWFQFKPQEHIYYFSPATLSRLAGKHGFAPVHLSGSGQFADLEFLHNRLAKYRFPMLDKLLRWAAAALGHEKKSWYMDTGSMLAVFRKKR